MKERLTILRDKIKQGGSKHPTDVGIASMTDDDISAYAQRIEDNIPYNERQAYNDSKRKYRHREVQRTDDRVREEKENEVLSADEQDLSDAKSRQTALPPTQRMTQALKKFVEDKRDPDSLLSTKYKSIRDELSPTNKYGGKIPQYKKRTIKYRT
jgi:hypothetical protein